MKKVLGLLLAVMMLVMPATVMAEGIDYASMSDEEIQELISSASKELENRGVSIKPSPDKYTHYVRNYVGRNLATIGLDYGNALLDEYGNSNMSLIIVTDDGSYIDLSDEEQLKQYIVVAQSVAPNSEVKYEYDIDENGVENPTLVMGQNYEQIELRVKKIDSQEAEPVEEQETSDENGSSEAATNAGIRPEFKETMDSYEAFFDEYVEFMKKYSESDDPTGMLADYASYMEKYADAMGKMDEVGTDSLSDEENSYYMEVTLRINAKLLELIGTA